MTPLGVSSPASRPVAGPGFDVTRVRRDFPILRTRVRGHPLVYFDNAATSQKPRVVVEAEADFALLHHANVHRGVHSLSQQATDGYDRVREDLRHFLNAREAAEIVFTSGTTASINLVAQAGVRPRLGAGDEILVTEMEHHSNLVPWQMVAQATGARIRAIPVTETGELDLAALDTLIGPRTRVVALAHVSNVLGTINPVRQVADRAHAVGALVVVDGAQGVAHAPVDVQALGADFYAASAHKMFGPTGVGFLYGRLELLETMPPWQGGGGMIQDVTIEASTYSPVPARFEAGTPPIAQVIGLGAAIRWLRSLDWPALQAYEAELLDYAATALVEVPGVRILGTAPEKVSVLSFVLDGVHPHDVGTVLDDAGVAVRAGHHCAQPLMRRFGVPATVRASFALYNTRAEVDVLLAGLRQVREIFG